MSRPSEGAADDHASQQPVLAQPPHDAPAADARKKRCVAAADAAQNVVVLPYGTGHVEPAQGATVAG